MTIVNLYPSKKLQLDWYIVTVWVISGFIFAFSFYHQYFNQIEPCSLCKWQRLIYLMVFSIAPISLIERFKIPIKMMLNFLFLIGLGLAIYHAAVQFGWLTHQCESPISKIKNAQEFYEMFQKSKTQIMNSCVTTGWKLFGWSAVIYNIFLSLCTLIFLNFNFIKIKIQNRRNKS